MYGPKTKAKHLLANGEIVALTADQWEIEDELQRIESAIGVGQSDQARRKAYQRERARFDKAHALPGIWHLQAGNESSACGSAAGNRGNMRDAPQALSRSSSRPTTWAGLSFPAVLLGTTALVCGGVLTLWSVFAGRADLWNVGWPIALAGQIALLVALLFQLEHLWADHRRTTEKIDQVDSRLHDLQRAPTDASPVPDSSGFPTYDPFVPLATVGLPRDEQFMRCDRLPNVSNR